MSNRYKSGPPAESLWGCIAGAILGILLFFFLLVAAALGDCGPGAACRKGFLGSVLLPSALSALVAFLLIRWAIKAAMRKRRRED